MSFPSAMPALPPTNTPSRVMGFPVGSRFSSTTLMTALRAGRSDSRPGWPSTTCRAAMSSHGQSPARRRCGTVMASAAAAVPGRTWWTFKAGRAPRVDGVCVRLASLLNSLDDHCGAGTIQTFQAGRLRAQLTRKSPENFHPAPKLIFKLSTFEGEKCARCPHGAAQHCTPSEICCCFVVVFCIYIYKSA